MMEIYNAILSVMADIGAIGKEKRNQQQNFNYRGIDDVMNALQPAMVKHGIFVVPCVLDQKREERQTGRGGTLLYSICTIKYIFYAKDGSSIEAIVVGEGMDSGDKATNKAMSVAFKYACFQVFCIPTEEMHDPDAETPPQSRKFDRGETKSKQVLNYASELKRALIAFYGDTATAAQAWKTKYSMDAESETKMIAHIEALKKAIAEKNEANI